MTTGRGPGPPSPGRCAVAEGVGTGFLVMAVVGSGIFAQRLSPGDEGLQLLENSIATAFALMALILAFGPVSGAHLNPAVTLADRLLGGMDSRRAAVYVAAQVIGGCAGAVTANLMFDLPAVEWSATGRTGSHLWLGEAVATFGLLSVVFGVVRSGRASTAPFAVGAYIGAAYWFTSSTSFANPAVTLGRTLTDTFTGIEPASVPPFLLAQLAGAAAAVALSRFLHPALPAAADDVILPHPRS